MSRTVAELLVDLLEQVGVTQIFGLIGDSLNPLGDAVRKSKKIEWIGVRHEEGAALAAAGQAKLTGRLAVCAGTTGPGSTHLVAGLYEAARDHAPVLAISGEMVRKQRGTDFIQTTTPELLFRDVSLYSETVVAPEQALAVFRNAIAAAYAGPGVAHLTMPQDILSASVSAEIKSVATLRPAPDILPLPQDMGEMIVRVDEAKSVVIMCGNGARGAEDVLLRVSDHLKAPLIHSVRGKDLMAYDDPHWMGGLGMIGTRPVYDAVRACDLLIMAGTDYPYSEYLPENGNVIQIDRRPQVLGRRTPTVLGVTGSVLPTMQVLLENVAAKTDSSFFDKVTADRAKWDAKLDGQCDINRSKDKIHPQAVARMAGDMAKRDAVFVFDTGINTLWSSNFIRQSGQQRIIGSFNNAAVGTALGQGNGVQALDRSRQVIVMTGDGGFNMLMGEFMTAVHHKLPVKVVIYNNSALGLITLEARGVGLVPFHDAIEFPNPDFAALARACGGEGFTARMPDELHDALGRALTCEGPAIVDCVVTADELPNVPHLQPNLLGNYALATVKEAVEWVTR